MCQMMWFASLTDLELRPVLTRARVIWGRGNLSLLLVDMGVDPYEGGRCSKELSVVYDCLNPGPYRFRWRVLEFVVKVWVIVCFGRLVRHAHVINVDKQGVSRVGGQKSLKERFRLCRKVCGEDQDSSFDFDVGVALRLDVSSHLHTGLPQFAPVVDPSG